MADNKLEKNIDFEMIMILMFIATVSFFFYMVKHPLFYITSSGVNRSALLYIYMTDLFVMMTALIPYYIMLFVLLIKVLVFKKKVADHMFMILFFPILAFFSKGMDLPRIYVKVNFISVIMDNYPFYLFIFLGILIAVFQCVLKKLHLKKD